MEPSVNMLSLLDRYKTSFISIFRMCVVLCGIKTCEWSLVFGWGSIDFRHNFVKGIAYAGAGNHPHGPVFVPPGVPLD